MYIIKNNSFTRNLRLRIYTERLIMADNFENMVYNKGMYAFSSILIVSIQNMIKLSPTDTKKSPFLQRVVRFHNG